VSYWEHKQDLSINLGQYPSSPYSPKKFNELIDFGASNPFSDEEISNSVYPSQKINVKGFREGQILTWSVAGFDILQAIGLPLPSMPNAYKSLYRLEPNPKRLEEFFEGCTFQFLSYLQLGLLVARRCLSCSQHEEGITLDSFPFHSSDTFIFPSSIVFEEHICAYNSNHNTIQYPLHTLVLPQNFAYKNNVYLFVVEEGDPPFFFVEGVYNYGSPILLHTCRIIQV
jgi:hypothetical protein